MLSLRRRRSKLPAVFAGTALLGVVSGSVLLSHLTIQARATPAAAPPAVTVSRPDQKVVEAGLPLRLRVPSIGIDARINALGIDHNGDMEAPTGPKDTGWYKLGTRPGSIGSAVVDGHYGRWKNGDTSVFDPLNKLAKGDKLYVQDDKGATYTFVVRELRMLGRNDDAKSVFTSTDKKAHLNLITCQGKWSESEKTYSNRLVVFADMQ